MSKPYHHGDLRTALLQAAETILDRDGIGALTLRAAAREAGVSHAAPKHHFGDLTGLVSELAASGFVRLRAQILAAAGASEAEPQARLIAFGRGYVGFARACPGLFRLMFRSERLDWSRPALSAAGPAAFALLTQDDAGKEAPVQAHGPEELVVAMARWSLVHGLATLLLDGRLDALTSKVAGAHVAEVIEGVLTRLAFQEAPPAAPRQSSKHPGAGG